MRLPGYDYTAPGAYFVTLCVRGGACVLGEIVSGEMVHSKEGRLVEGCWADLPNHYPHVRLDAFVVMPNHVHGVLVLVDDDHPGMGLVGAGFHGSDGAYGAGPRSVRALTTARGVEPAPTGATAGDTEPTPTSATADDSEPAPTPLRRHALPEIVHAFKTFSARRINALRGTSGQPFWQRSYYEHVIRNRRELDAIRTYIDLNPLRWELDREHPGHSASRRHTHDG